MRCGPEKDKSIYKKSKQFPLRCKGYFFVHHSLEKNHQSNSHRPFPRPRNMRPGEAIPSPKNCPSKYQPSGYQLLLAHVDHKERDKS